MADLHYSHIVMYVVCFPVSFTLINRIKCEPRHFSYSSFTPCITKTSATRLHFSWYSWVTDFSYTWSSVTLYPVSFGYLLTWWLYDAGWYFWACTTEQQTGVIMEMIRQSVVLLFRRRLRCMFVLQCSVWSLCFPSLCYYLLSDLRSFTIVMPNTQLRSH